MKKAYRKPKAMAIDFRYDEQVTASSGGNVADYGDPQHIGKCQQSNAASCKAFWYVASQPCQTDPFSKPGGNPVVD